MLLKRLLDKKLGSLFFDELKTKPLKQMSENARWVAELLVKLGYAELVL